MNTNGNANNDASGGASNVRYLPSAERAADELEPSEVLDGEELTEEEAAAYEQRRIRSMDDVRAMTEQWTVDAYLAVKRSPYPPRIGKALVRHTLYLAHGVQVVRQRRRDARSNTLPLRMARAAEAAGDHEQAGAWWDRSEKSVQDRHQRRQDWMDAPKKLATAAAIGAGALAVLLLVMGGLLAYTTRDVSAVLDPFIAIGNTVATVFTIITVAWLWLVLAAAGIGGAYLWGQGKSHSTWEPPAWAAPVGANAELPDRTEDPITPSKVVLALRDLKITELRKAIERMSDAGAGMLGPITVVGCGVEVEAYLPPRVTPGEVQKEHPRLAGNLDRHEHELFITIPPRARSVRMLIADSGALDDPIGQSALVTDDDTAADYYTGKAPWGETLRGEPFALSLKQLHVLITGLSNQGKSACVRALLLWLLHDVTVEFRYADLKGIGDWRMFRDIATVAIEGPSDEHVIAATEMLEDGVEEMERRLRAVDADRYPDGVTRQLSRSGQGFHPLVLFVDEAQLAFMCPAKDDDKLPYGGKSNKSRFFMACRRILNQGRAVNVTLWLGTQEPTDHNLPKIIREAFHIRASLVVGTIQQSRMALGDKAVDGGASPHKLRQDLDKGTLIVAGSVPLDPGASSVTVRTNFVSGSDAGHIAERIKQRRSGQPAPEPDQRDLLADVDHVLNGQPRVKTTDVAARLRKLAPHWEPYRQLDGTQLAELLTEAGVRITAYDGYPQVYAERVETARVASDGEV